MFYIANNWKNMVCVCVSIGIIKETLYDTNKWIMDTSVDIYITGKQNNVAPI